MGQEFLHDINSIKPSIDAEAAISSDQVILETDDYYNAEVEAILAQANIKVKERLRRYTFNCTFVPIILVILIAFPFILFKSVIFNDPRPYCVYAGALFVVACKFIFGDSMQAFPFNKEELIRMGGVKAIGTIIDACSMNIPYKQVRALYTIVIPLLQQLKASDSYLLTRAHRHHLHAWLRAESQGVRVSEESLKLKLAALKALEQIGNKDSIPVVQRLADMKPRTDLHRQLKEAALECLPYLEARLGIDSAKTTLLRGSTPEISPQDTLLRPATDKPSTHTDELLRPTDDK